MLVTDDELAGLQPRATHTIDLDEFVELDEIDPIFFHGAYHVAPEERAAKSYVLLVEAMEQANKVAIARFVMRSKQYVAALRPRDGRLTLSMMVYEDEINPATEIPEFDALEDISVTDKELAHGGAAHRLAVRVLRARPLPRHLPRGAARPDPRQERRCRDACRAPFEAPSDDTVIDLMAALEASVSAAKEARGRHPTAMADEDDVVGALRPPARKATAKSTSRKATAKKPSASATKAATEGRGEEGAGQEGGRQEGDPGEEGRGHQAHRQEGGGAGAQVGLTSAEPGRPALATKGTSVEVGGRTLTLTNLDKVLYPAVGFTKSEVIDYYARVAPTMLAHTAGRCMTFKRYPERGRRQVVLREALPVAPSGVGAGRDRAG